MSEKLRIAFLGVGYMGQNAHMKNYYELSDRCEIVAIAEARPELGKKVATHYCVPKVFTTYEDMLAGAEFDAVVASQSFSNHINIVPMVLKSKKHLLTEKPLCICQENAKILADLADETGMLHMVGYHKRSDPASEYAKKIINEWKISGEYGKMRLLRISMPPGNWVGGAPRPIGTDEAYPQLILENPPEYFPGQLGKDYVTFVNYYIHQVNYMHFVMDEPLHVQYVEPSGAVMVAAGASGVPAVLEMAAYETRDDWQESIFAAFEHGYVRVDLPAPLADRQPGRVWIFRGKKEELATLSEATMPRIAAMQKQAYNFISAVRGECPAPCSSREAVEDLRVATGYIRMMNGIT